MALVLKNRVLETCTSPGTGTVTLLGATTGYQTFSATVGNGNTCYYTIADQGSANWEVGIGTYATTGNTLTRTTVLSSSNGGGLTNFSTGTQNVFVNYPAEKAVYLDASGNYVPSTPTFTSITDSGLTSGRVTYAGTGGLLQDSANLTFNGTTLTTANDATINGNNVGKGGGAVASNQSFGGFNLSKNTTGNNNTAIGYFALYQNLTGGNNIGIGVSALQNNTTGSNQTAIGFQALNAATTAVATFGSVTAGSGYTNGTYTAVAMTPVSGATFLTYPTVTVVVAGGVVSTVTLVTAGGGASSTAATVLTVAAALIGGTGSGFSIPVATFATAAQNTAFGFGALSTATTALANTAVGYQALNANTTGGNNSAYGANALATNTIGTAHTAIGVQALQTATTIVGSLGTVTGGTGYTNGTYTGVVMTLSSGSSAITYPTVTIVVAGGVVSTVTLTAFGSGFKDTTTVLTAPAASIGGTGSGFTVPVATLLTASSNVAIGFQALNSINYGSNHTALGYQAGSTTTAGGNNLILGSLANASSSSVSNEITLGNSSITAFRIPGLSITASPSALTVGSQFAVTNTASAVNYLQATGSVASSAPILSAQGSDTDIGITLTPKGAGAVTTAASVGIGTTTPNAQFELVNSGNAVAVARSTALTNGSYFLAAGYDYFSGPSYRTTQLIQYNVSAGGTALGLNNANLGVLSFQNASNAAIFTNSGNILRIGTNSTTAISIASNQVISLGAAAGSESLRVTPVASAVNYVSVFGAVTGQTPTISPQGSDTNIPLGLSSKGTSALTFYTNAFGNIQFNIANTASAVNYLQATGAVTTGAPVLSAAGSDTNIDLALTPKGTGSVTTGSPVIISANSASDALRITQIGAGNALLVEDSANPDASPFVIDASGNVGIGTITPNANLEVVGSPANFIARGSTTTSSAQVGAVAHDYFSGPSYKGTSLVQYSATASGTTLGISNASLGSLTFNNTAANALIYTNGGTGIIFGTLSIDRGRVSSAGIWSLGAAAGSESLRVTPVASAVNYLNVVGAITTASPAIQAAGSDANINVILTPKGTGVLQFGTYTAGILAQAGYITIKDAGGTTRNLLVG